MNNEVNRKISRRNDAIDILDINIYWQHFGRYRYSFVVFELEKTMAILVSKS